MKTRKGQNDDSIMVIKHNTLKIGLHVKSKSVKFRSVLHLTCEYRLEIAVVKGGGVTLVQNFR